MTKEQKQLYSVVDKAKRAISGVENFAEELIQQFEQEREAYDSMKNLADAAIAESKGKAAFSTAAADVWKRKAKQLKSLMQRTAVLQEQTRLKFQEQSKEMGRLTKARDRYQQLADENASLWDKAQDELNLAKAELANCHLEIARGETAREHESWQVAELTQKVEVFKKMLHDMEQERDEARAQAAAAQSAENEARGRVVMWMMFAAGGWCIGAAVVVALRWGVG